MGDSRSQESDPAQDEGAGIGPLASHPPSELEENTEAQEDPAEAEVLSPAVQLEIKRIVQSVVAWSAPLPYPDIGEQYNHLRSDTFSILVDDYERTSLREDRLANHQIEMDQRQMAFLEREQVMRERESNDDIATRGKVLGRGFFIELVLIIVGVTIFFASDLSGWVRVTAFGLALTPVIVTRGMSLLRGRFSDNETNVLRDAMPVFKALAENSKGPNLPKPDVSQPKE